MPKQSPTQNPTKVGEFVALLRNSDLPTVIVEGADDMRIFQWIEARLGSRTADVLPVGGRKNLLSIYEKRSEYNHIPVAFLADRDLWLFSGVSQHYNDIIWTKGYSIENDLYASAQLEDMLDPQETKGHQQLLDLIVEWFAFEVGEHLSGRCIKIDQHCDEIVKPGQTTIDEGFRERRGLCPPDKELRQQIRNAYQLELRGKNLFEVLARFLNSPGRRTNYSKIALLEIAFKMTPFHSLMSRLIQEIEQTLTDQKSALRHAKPSQ